MCNKYFISGDGDKSHGLTPSNKVIKRRDHHDLDVNNLILKQCKQTRQANELSERQDGNEVKHSRLAFLAETQLVAVAMCKKKHK